MPIHFGKEVFLALDEAAAYLDVDFSTIITAYFFQYTGQVWLDSQKTSINGMVRIEPDVFKRMRIALDAGKPVIVFAFRSGDGIMSDGRGWIGYKGRKLDFECGTINGREISATFGLPKFTMPEAAFIKEAAFFVKQSSLDAIARQFGIEQRSVKPTTTSSPISNIMQDVSNLRWRPRNAVLDAAHEYAREKWRGGCTYDHVEMTHHILNDVADEKGELRFDRPDISKKVMRREIRKVAREVDPSFVVGTKGYRKNPTKS